MFLGEYFLFFIVYFTEFKFNNPIFKNLLKSDWEKSPTLAVFFLSLPLTVAGIINEVRFGIDSTNLSSHLDKGLFTVCLL